MTEKLKQIASKIDPIIDKDCYAWIGSGLSASDYPKWIDFINSLCDACSIKRIDGNITASLLMEKADECKNANISLYESSLAKTFGNNFSYPRRAVEKLLKLPFKGYITTNFDPMLSTLGADFENCELFCYPHLPLKNI